MRREETWVPGENPRSQVKIDWNSIHVQHCSRGGRRDWCPLRQPDFPNSFIPQKTPDLQTSGSIQWLCEKEAQRRKAARSVDQPFRKRRNETYGICKSSSWCHELRDHYTKVFTVVGFLAVYWTLRLISINLLVVYRESVNLIGYLTRRLSADSLQLWIANENRLFWTRDACFTPQCISCAVFETLLICRCKHNKTFFPKRYFTFLCNETTSRLTRLVDYLLVENSGS